VTTTAGAGGAAYDAAVQTGEATPEGALSGAQRQYLIDRVRDTERAVETISGQMEGWKQALKSAKDEHAAAKRAAREAGVSVDGE